MKNKHDFGDATRRLATKECTRDVTGLKQLDRNRPYGQIRSACGIVGLRQDGIVFDLDGYESTGGNAWT